MGLFVVGRLAARHGVRVRLRHAQAGGLTALIWLPDTVAAPEVAPPLGRLRRFEADDFGPAPSLSAPTATAPPPGPSAASQATAAARIPRFSPTAPGGPAAPAPPSFTPAANAGSPGAPAMPGQVGAPGNGAPGNSGQGAPAQGGSPAGNNWEPAGNGWDLGNSGRGAVSDGPPTQALPVRNGNGHGTSNGQPAGEVAEPRSPAAGGPSRMPAFGGPGGGAGAGTGAPGPQPPQFPIDSRSVHGSDGPSAADAAHGVVATGPGSGGQGRGDTNDGPVSVPAGGPEQRLPIFDSLESDWFRRSGKPLTAPQRGGTGAQVQASPQVTQSSWTSPADEGWRAAQVVASPAAGDTTQAGLPKRVPRANLVPGSVGGSGGTSSHEAEPEAPARSADAARSRMASFQRGVRDGRAAAPQNEEP
jgi:hypothetical protein